MTNRLKLLIWTLHHRRRPTQKGLKAQHGPHRNHNSSDALRRRLACVDDAMQQVLDAIQRLSRLNGRWFRQTRLLSGGLSARPQVARSRLWPSRSRAIRPLMLRPKSQG